MREDRCPFCLGDGFEKRFTSSTEASMRVPEGTCGVCNGTGRLTDDELEAAFRRTTMQPGDPEADAIIAELERRGSTLH